MKDTKSQRRTGGSHNEKGRDQDIFFTTAVAGHLITILLERENLREPGEYNVLDACCGRGVLGMEYRQAKHHAATCSIDYVDTNNQVIPSKIDQNDTVYQENILDWNPWQRKYDIIFCNPPWAPYTTALDIFGHLRCLLSDKGTLFFVINNTFLYQNAGNAKNLAYHDFVALPRYIFAGSGKPLLDCGVIISHKEDQEPANFIFIPHNLCKMTQKQCDENSDLGLEDV